MPPSKPLAHKDALREALQIRCDAELYRWIRDHLAHSPLSTYPVSLLIQHIEEQRADLDVRYARLRDLLELED